MEAGHPISRWFVGQHVLSNGKRKIVSDALSGHIGERAGPQKLQPLHLGSREQDEPLPKAIAEPSLERFSFAFLHVEYWYPRLA